MMPVCEVVDFPHAGARHQRERAAGVFDAIDILAHRFQDVGQIPCSHDRTVGTPDFREPNLPRLGGALVEPDERKSSLVQVCLAVGLCSPDGGPLLRPVIRGSAFVLAEAAPRITRSLSSGRPKAGPGGSIRATSRFHRSISPNTMSSDPMIAATSANM